MKTPLITACDNVYEAMFIAKFAEEEIEVLKALRRLIDSTIALYEKREGMK